MSLQQKMPVADPARKRVLDLLAEAKLAELEQAWANCPTKPSVELLRGPETGLVMVRGRMGGGGSAFNLGEATVTRATIRLATGHVGHAHALGTEREKVRLAAIMDALWQDEQCRSFVEDNLLRQVEQRLADATRRKAEETAATRVDFFTMVRGENG